LTSTKRVLLVLVAAAGLLAAGQATVGTAAAKTITTSPATLGTPDNCWPFGVGDPGEWGPFAGFVYKNIPAFQLRVGDTVGFDLGGANDADVQLDVALAATTSNGGDVPAAGFTAVATNTQTPANPRGDTTAGDYELRFTAEAPFDFAGGGLIIRFSNPSAGYTTDLTCDAVVFDGVRSTDASGFFTERFARDDGSYPWTRIDNGPIAPVQLTLTDTPSSGPGVTGQRAAALKKCKKNAHKKHWSKKKLRKCKKKANLLPV
jgi:hypothetical protein